MTHAEGVGGQLSDQLWSFWAALRAYQEGFGDRWLEIALDLAAHLEERYADSELGGYFDHAGTDENFDLGRPGERVKPLAENSVAAIALNELDTPQADPASPHPQPARPALEAVAAPAPPYRPVARPCAPAPDPPA